MNCIIRHSPRENPVCHNRKQQRRRSDFASQLVVQCLESKSFCFCTWLTFKISDSLFSWTGWFALTWSATLKTVFPAKWLIIYRHLLQMLKNICEIMLIILLYQWLTRQIYLITTVLPVASVRLSDPSPVVYTRESIECVGTCYETTKKKTTLGNYSSISVKKVATLI